MNRQWRKAQQAKWNCLLALFPIPPHTHTCKWTLMLFNVYCMWWPSLNSIGVIKKDSSGVATRWRHMLASIRGGHIPEKKKKKDLLLFTFLASYTNPNHLQSTYCCPNANVRPRRDLLSAYFCSCTSVILYFIQSHLLSAYFTKMFP